MIVTIRIRYISAYIPIILFIILHIFVVDDSCYSVSVGDNSVTLYRKRNQMTIYQRMYKSKCRDIPPVELVQKVISKANIEPVIFANLSDPVSKELVEELYASGALSMLVDIEKAIPWSRIMPSIKRYKALLIACDSACVFNLIKQVRDEKGSSIFLKRFRDVPGGTVLFQQLL